MQIIQVNQQAIFPAGINYFFAIRNHDIIGYPDIATKPGNNLARI